MASRCSIGTEHKDWFSLHTANGEFYRNKNTGKMQRQRPSLPGKLDSQHELAKINCEQNTKSSEAISNHENLGLRVRHVRELKMMSVSELAGHLGIDTRKVRYIEANMLHPDHSLVDKIENILQINPGSLPRSTPGIIKIHFNDPIEKSKQKMSKIRKSKTKRLKLSAAAVANEAATVAIKCMRLTQHAVEMAKMEQKSIDLKVLKLLAEADKMANDQRSEAEKRAEEKRAADVLAKKKGIITTKENLKKRLQIILGETQAKYDELFIARQQRLNRTKSLKRSTKLMNQLSNDFLCFVVKTPTVKDGMLKHPSNDITNCHNNCTKIAHTNQEIFQRHTNKSQETETLTLNKSQETETVNNRSKQIIKAADRNMLIKRIQQEVMRASLICKTFDETSRKQN